VPVLCVPEIAFDPDHPPEAVHDVALVELQASVAELPEATEVGLAEILTVGAAGDEVTVTVADCVADPPVPVHVRL
jgi:hypothetical protein